MKLNIHASYFISYLISVKLLLEVFYFKSIFETIQTRVLLKSSSVEAIWYSWRAKMNKYTQYKIFLKSNAYYSIIWI